MIAKFLRRMVVMSFGFIVAVSAGAVLLPLMALVDPQLRDGGLNAAVAFAFALVENPDYLDHGYPLSDAFEFFQMTLIAVCVAPLAIVALIGEAAGQRSWIWHAAGCGVIAAAAPWIARMAYGSPRAHGATQLELRVAALFFLTGALTGWLYWLIAVRGRKA